MSWQAVKIGKFLTRVKKSVDIEEEKLYKRVTIKTKNQGVVLRDSEKGSLIGTKKQFLVSAGQFILSKIDARYGAFGIVPNELDNAIITGNFWTYEVDKNFLNIELFSLFTSSQNFIDICAKASSGSTHRKYLDEQKFLNFEILLPDIDEQNNILLFFQKKNSVLKELKSEILMQENFLKKLRQSILQEAIEGKLTAKWREENPTVEPAYVLLDKIKAEKDKLITDGKIKKEKPLPSIKEDEIPFDIPENWHWCRLESLIDTFSGGYAFSSECFIDNGNLQVLRLGNIRPNTVRFDEKAVFISGKVADEATLAELKVNDLLITMTGTRGKRDYCYTVLLQEEHFRNRRLFLNQRIGCFRFHKFIDARFYDIALKSDMLIDIIFATATGSANQANIGSTALKLWQVPLPPIEEQKAIVEKVENLFAMCDELEKQVKASKLNTENITKSILKEAFANEN